MNYLFEKVNNFAIYLGLETNSQDIKDKKRALSLIENQLNSGVAIQYIMTMIIRQFRLILKIKSFSENKVTQDWAIAQTLKLPNFVIKKILRQSNLFKLKELKKIYQQLLLIDEKIKIYTGKEKILLLKMINEF